MELQSTASFQYKCRYRFLNVCSNFALYDLGVPPDPAQSLALCPQHHRQGHENSSPQNLSGSRHIRVILPLP